MQFLSMQKFQFACVFGLALTLLGGCGQSQVTEKELADFIQDQTNFEKKVVGILENIQTKEDMKKALAQLKTLNAQGNALAKRARNLKDRKADVPIQYQEQLFAVLAKKRREMDRIKKLPLGDEFINQLDQIKVQNSKLLTPKLKP